MLENGWVLGCKSAFTATRHSGTKIDTGTALSILRVQANVHLPRSDKWRRHENARSTIS